MNTNRAVFTVPSTPQALKFPTNAVPHSTGSVNWTPSNGILEAIANILKETTTGNTYVQTQIYAQMQSFATQKEFTHYLVYILVYGHILAPFFPQQIDGIRQAAGLLLKTNIRLLYYKLPSITKEYLHIQLLVALGNTSNIVRQSAATCISNIVVISNDVASFPGLITTLAQSLDSDIPSLLDGSFKVLNHLAEEVPDLLERDKSRPLDILLPKILRLCNHRSDSVRADSLQILNHLILTMPKALFANVDRFCHTLFSRVEDSSAQVRKRVCTAICLLMEVAPGTLMPYMNSIIQYMLISSRHPDELIAREASEFWSLIANLNGGAEVLRPFLPQIVPVLLNNMVYSAEDISLYEAENVRDDMVPDREEDLRPRFHQANLKGTGSANNDGRNESVGQTANGSGTSHEEDDSEDGDVDLEDFDGISEWNLRKCSARALDFFSMLFKDELLAVLLPRLQQKLTDTERWEQRECGVLALGAIAEGCFRGMLRHMGSLFPFLLQQASDQQVMVRMISCWSLSRYSQWVISEHKDALVRQLLKVFLERMLDHNKLVQKAACSALVVFIEESGSLIKTYLIPVLRSLGIAFERYQRRNTIALYDVISTMANAVGPELANPEYLNLLMPLFRTRWSSTLDMDPLIISLLECLGHVFRALGIHSQKYAANMFSRCLILMDEIYAKESRGESEDKYVDILTSCLDLMCVLAQALGLKVEQFVSMSMGGSQVLPILFVCMKDNRQEVRQSVFALLGEFARARIPSLAPALPEYIQGAVEALNPVYIPVANNATWALGELVVMAGFLPRQLPINRENIKRTLLEEALDPLIHAVNNPQLNKSLVENSALTLGRLGLILAEAVAPKLGTFAESVFSSLQNIRDDVKKEQAFHGMNAMVKLNPRAILDGFVRYVRAIANCLDCKTDLEKEFASILTGYKTSLGDQWFPLFSSFPPALQSVVKERFGI